MVSWSQGVVRYVCVIAFVFISLWITGCHQLSATSKQVLATQKSVALEFIPRQALLATVVDITNRSAWQHSSLEPGISKAMAELLAPLDINFAEDIRPWLGSFVAFAITDIDLDRDRRNGRQAGYLLVAEVSDSERLREFLGLFWQRQAVAGVKLHFTQANGAPIIAGPVNRNLHQLSTAIVGERTLLISNDVKILRQSLQVAQSPSLQMSAPDCCAPLWVTLQIPSLVDWLGMASPENLQFMGIRQWQQLRAAATLTSQGITIKTRLMAGGVTEDLDNSPTLENTYLESKPQQYLPNSISWAAMGHNLFPVWATLQAELKHYQKLPFFLQQLQQWSATAMGRKLNDPLRLLLANDYGVGQFRDGSWVMVTSAAEPRVLSQLDKIASDVGLTVSQLLLSGHTVTAWSELKTRFNRDSHNRETMVETDLMALRTKVDDYDVFATSLSGLTAALDAPGQSLSATQRFQETTQVMDTPNQGYIYGTWHEMERLLASNRWFSLVQPIVQSWGQSIDAIAVTSYGNTNDQSTGTVSILLKK